MLKPDSDPAADDSAADECLILALAGLNGEGVLDATLNGEEGSSEAGRSLRSVGFMLAPAKLAVESRYVDGVEGSSGLETSPGAVGFMPAGAMLLVAECRYGDGVGDKMLNGPSGSNSEGIREKTLRGLAVTRISRLVTECLFTSDRLQLQAILVNNERAHLKYLAY